MKIEINSYSKIGYKKISEAEKGNTSGHLSHIGIGASLDGIPMNKNYKCFLYFDNKISEHATHLKLSTKEGSPMIQGAECTIEKIKYSSLYNEIRSKIDENPATKEWLLIWTIDKGKQIFFALMSSDSSDYSILSESFPELSELGRRPKLLSRNESEFNVVLDYLNSKFFQSQSNPNKDFWLFFDCKEAFDTNTRYKFAMTRKSISNPKTGDEIAIIEQDNNKLIGHGKIVCGEKLTKYKKDVLGRSNKSDKIDFYAVEFILTELNEISLDFQKKELEEIDRYSTGHKQKISEKLFRLLINAQGSRKLNLNQILYGPPGTGKTFNVINEALAIVDSEFDATSNTEDERRKVVAKFNQYKAEGRISFITFHQSYSYEDFVLGIMPDVNNQHLKFNRKEGIFYRIVEKAKNDKEKLPYVLVIDEINRANISRVFGELITLIEVDKRLGAVNELTVELPNEPVEKDPTTGEEKVKNFGVPSNLYLLGTMNTADKSIAALDIALRRRFTFKALYPDKSKVKDEKLAKLMEVLNKQIDNNDKNGKYYRGADFTIGHSYFMNKTIKNCSEIFNNSVIPLLMEYYMNDIEMVQGILKEIELDSFYENGTIKIK